MLNNVYTVNGTHKIDTYNKVIQFKCDVIADNEKEANYKAKCMLKDYVNDLSVLSSIEVDITKSSKLKQIVRNILPSKIKVNTY